MPRAPKTLDQLKQEAEKAQKNYEKKLEQERKKVVEQFFKDNPEIVTIKDYKEMKKEQIVPEKTGTKNDVISEANKKRIEFADNFLKEFGTVNLEEIKNRMVQNSTDEIAQLSKDLFLKYADNITKDLSGKVTFTPRSNYHDFFNELIEIKERFKD